MVEFLGQLVVFPFANESAIWSGHTIPGQDSVVPGSPLTAVCFAFPDEPEGFQPICLDGEHIYVLWAVPIYEVERQYKVANGSAALWRLFGEKGVEVWDLRRGPAVQ